MTGYCDGCGNTGGCTCPDDAANEYVEGLQKQLAEANKKLAEAQARIKVLEDCVDGYRGQINRFGKCTAGDALSITSPTEALDKVVREAVEKERRKIPDLLFDGYSVYQSLVDVERARTSSENVCDVLDAIVRLMRKRNAEIVRAQRQ